MSDRTKRPENKNHVSLEEYEASKMNEGQNMVTQTGKTFEEILPYLTAGEPDD